MLHSNISNIKTKKLIKINLKISKMLKSNKIKYLKKFNNNNVKKINFHKVIFQLIETILMIKIPLKIIMMKMDIL